MESVIPRVQGATSPSALAPAPETGDFLQTYSSLDCVAAVQSGSATLAMVSIVALLLGCTLAEGDADTGPPAKSKKAVPAGNRLARETSPYLLAHAHNPVDWYPWGPEALEKARKEDKPIFLSIGYSSCHWCHVMEKKVFSNPEIARYMNEHFVNIKVDREERPDLDDIYMTALQMYYQAIGSTQTGGWPLSLFLTPDGRPLGGGTYFPPEDEDGRGGFPSLMKKVVESWRDSRQRMEANADILANAVRAASRPKLALKAPELTRTLLEPVLRNLADSYDAEQGGFGFSQRSPDRPKFPVPTRLALLQYESHRHAADDAGKMLYHTLDRMAAGGIYDHVGGGFHRYSTDRYWRIPHFEKMLYDNAQLADIYAEAYRHTNQPLYRAIAEQTLEFVLRDLADPQGGFYAALDADSEGVEGKYYVWTSKELADVLSPAELKACRVVYGTARDPNFELGYVLEMEQTIDDAATGLQTTAVQLEKQLVQIRRKLLTARQQRIAPARDDKILTSWNGLMIRALARASVIFKRQDFLQAAEKAASFILAEMRDDKGRLYRSYRAKQARHPAYLDDYAYLVEGLLALKLATDDEKWGNAARRLADLQLQLFWDETGKGCYFTSHDHEALLARTKNAYDSVLPSGNSVTVRNLLRLATISRQPDYRDRAKECLELFVPLIEDSPTGLTNMALALAEYLDQPEAIGARKSKDRSRAGIAPDREIILVGGQSEEPLEPSPKRRKKQDIVTGQAFLSVDRLPAGGQCKVLVQLQVAEGWHIRARTDDSQEEDNATELTMESELGSELTTVLYPRGVSHVEEPDGDRQMVYTGHVALLGKLVVPAEAAGRRENLTFSVRYQACTAGKCLLPTDLEIVLPVQVAPTGATVKPANEKVFLPAKKK